MVGFEHQKSKHVRPCLHGSHDRLHILGVQLKHAVENADLIIPQWLFPTAVELEEGLQLCLLVGGDFVVAEYVVEQLSYRPGDGS